jgi:hypothetical protein
VPSASTRQRALIRQAAAVTGKTVTELVLDSACMAAEQALLDRRALPSQAAGAARVYLMHRGGRVVGYHALEASPLDSFQMFLLVTDLRGAAGIA